MLSLRFVKEVATRSAVLIGRPPRWVCRLQLPGDRRRCWLTHSYIQFCQMRSIVNVDHTAPISRDDIEPAADLSGVDLTDTDLSNANLRRTDFSGADLTDATLPEDFETDRQD